MILQALHAYYLRRLAEGTGDLASEGFEKKEIPFLVVLTADGGFVDLKDTREPQGKKLVGKTFLLPRSEGRTGVKGFEKPFLLWDHIGFLFGVAKEPKDAGKAAKQHGSWLRKLQELPPDLQKDPGVRAVMAFYERGEASRVLTHPSWPECLKLPSCNMTFLLAGDTLPVPCRPAVQEFQKTLTRGGAGEPGEEGDGQTVTGLCLITGARGEIARIHGRTPIDKDTKSLVAFQKHSGYDSYGKEQCFNAPVSKSAEFAYVTGLNTLLKSQTQRLLIGNTVTVFWSERRSELEDAAGLFFNEPPPDDPHSHSASLRALYDSIWKGSYQVPNDQTRFFVLGLSPNSARISVRFWEVGTVKEIGARLLRHVEDLAIVTDRRQDPALPLRRLLRSIAPQEKEEDIPPNLVGETVRAILEGTPYPASLLQAVIRRIRAEQSKKNRRTGNSEPHVTHPRAALIKACLNRALRRHNPNQEKEMTMSLDPTNNNVGYRLGRLFAALEKIQADAQKSINATIRDRFYGAASGSPVTVFGNLMRLKNHHLAKLPDGLRITRERQLQEIIDGLPASGFPSHLDLADQGRFAIGYYHQMQAFFTKKNESETSEKE